MSTDEANAGPGLGADSGSGPGAGCGPVPGADSGPGPGAGSGPGSAPGLARTVALLRRADAAVARVESAVLVVLLGVLVVAGFWQVVQRNLGSAAASWVDTFNRHLVLWIGLLGAMLATHEGKHVNIEAVRKFLPRAVERWVETVVHLFSAAVAGFFAWVSWHYLRGEMASPIVLFRVESLGWAVQTWWTEVILPAAFAVIAVRFLAHSAAAALGVPKPPAEPVEEAMLRP